VNYLAHFHIATQLLTPTLPLPEYVVGAALPDLLPLAERRVRLRPAQVASAETDTRFEAALAAGVLAHLVTDAAFHKTAAFASAQAEVSRLLAEAAFVGMRIRRFFVAHVLTEIALDAAMLRAELFLADRFYDAFAAADFELTRHWTESVTQRPVPDLTFVLARFQKFQYLREYAGDGGVATGLSNVCRRAGQDTFDGENFGRLVGVVGKVVRVLPDFVPAIFSETAAGILHGGVEHGLYHNNAADEVITWRTE